MLTDYHLHSNFSGDSKTPMEEMILAGIQLGLTTMCFTEHMDFDFPDPSINFTVDTATYYRKLFELKALYQTKIHLLFGIELGLQPHLSPILANYANEYPFDFIIGSSHLADRLDPYSPSFYEGRTEKESYQRYFSSILENLAAFTDFDVYGHLDYVVRYGPNKNKYYTYLDYQDVIDQILRTLIEKGIGLECNSAGFKYGLGHPHPCEDILRRYKELGGEILTVGSDAHMPEHIAYAFDQVQELLSDCGFKYYTVFENRKAKFIRL